jgi:hypothetical protein
VATPLPGGRCAPEHPDPWRGRFKPARLVSRHAGFAKALCPLDWHVRVIRLSLQRAQPARRPRPANTRPGSLRLIGSLRPQIEGSVASRATPVGRLPVDPARKVGPHSDSPRRSISSAPGGCSRLAPDRDAVVACWRGWTCIAAKVAHPRTGNVRGQSVVLRCEDELQDPN